jgi:hypothetical protein
MRLTVIRFTTVDGLAELAGLYKSYAKIFGTSSVENGTANRCPRYGRIVRFAVPSSTTMLLIVLTGRFQFFQTCIMVTALSTEITVLVHAIPTSR